ncbi:MAG: sensor histidine kinase [Vulcanococcus sp.]
MVASACSFEALRHCLADGVPPGRSDEDSVRRQWWAALSVLQDDLLLPLGAQPGVWLAAPLPALYEPSLLKQFQGWVWAPPELKDLLQSTSPLLPAGAATPAASGGFQRLALEDGDGTDPVLLLITPRLQIAMALVGAAQARRLVVRFDPPTLSAALTQLDERLQRCDPQQGEALRRAMQALGELRCDQDQAQLFWPLLAERLASMAPSVTLQPLVHRGGEGASSQGPSSELALLEALTHEVRTPLATIRTLIRSLLRRTDLSELVRKRLHQIDGECSEQIDRFGLIFLAAELQREPVADQEQRNLARTDLSQLLHQLQPLWQQQLDRRGLMLELNLSPDLPLVLSDPARLETVLGGLMDRFSRGLPAGSRVQLSLQPAGARLKLRLSALNLAPAEVEGGVRDDQQERVGPVLSWNPGTGSLQLSRQATQRLFHSLGGRLAERSGNDLTVFFPVAVAEA